MTDLNLYHNSFERTYREPFGAVAKGSNLALAIDICQHIHLESVILHYIYDKSDKAFSIEMDVREIYHTYARYQANITMPGEPQLVWYYFEVVTDEGSIYYGRESVEESGVGRGYQHVPPSWQVTVFDPTYETPTWWKHATMYQIFPDRFNIGGELKSSKAPKASLLHAHWDDEPIYIKDNEGKVERWNFFGGNLQGIIEKLDYIQSLGVTVIYLNPIFQAESNHRYDTGDYHRIDPLLGTKQDLEQLLQEASRRNIEIMLDGVFSHTGSNSIYFNRKEEYDSVGAYQSVESPYYSWYTFYQYPDEYEAWWGIETLPTLKKENESYQRFLVHNEDSVIKTWQKSGIKHWRLDVADELTDSLIQKIYQQLKKEDSSAVLLGEVWEDASNKIAYEERRDYLLGGVLDSVMNYPLRQFLISFIKGEIGANVLLKKLLTLAEHYPKQYFYAVMNMLSSHDVERIKTVLVECMPEDIEGKEQKEKLTNQLKALSLWLYSFPGVPSIYYGDEAGLMGGKDPDNRKPYPWGKEEKELVSWYQLLGNWWQQYPALRTGNWRPYAANDDVFAMERWIVNGADVFGHSSKNGHFLYMINRSVREGQTVALPERKGKWQELLGENIYDRTVHLQPCEGKLLKLID